MKKSISNGDQKTLALSDIRKPARPVLLALRTLQSGHRTTFTLSEIAQWVRDHFGDGRNDGGAGMTSQAIRMLYRLGLISAHSGKYRLRANGQRLADLADLAARNRALAIRWSHDRLAKSANQPKQASEWVKKLRVNAELLTMASQAADKWTRRAISTTQQGISDTTHN
jgi:hypothetical protein